MQNSKHRKLDSFHDKPVGVDRDYNNFNNASKLNNNNNNRMKKWRLIVRNLSFKASETDLKGVFGKFGELEHIVLPSHSKGRHPGFAFIQYRNFKDAVSAIRSINGSNILNRPVAVDYAIPKDQFLSATLSDPFLAKVNSSTPADIVPSEHDVKPGKQVTKVKQTTKPKPGSDDDSESGDDSSKDSVSDEDESDDEKKDPEEVEDTATTSMSNIDRPSDTQEGKTIFVRNLSFDTTQESLTEYFEKFGLLKYAVICMFAGTDHSKGSAFIQFEDKLHTDQCLDEYETARNIQLDGRFLELCRAVSRTDARKMQNDKLDKTPKDKRNLHLLRIGLIRADSKFANGMSELDTAKRIKIESANRQKIRDLNFFVSPTRICIHNVPKRLTDKELRSICFDQTDHGGAVIKECRIMRNTNPTNQETAQSLGFAFVEFTWHEHALKCLKAFNNNPTAFTDDKRPIVEFAIENRRALQIKADRQAKSQVQRVTSINESNDQPAESLKRKMPVSKFNTPVVAPVNKNLGYKPTIRPFPKKLGAKNRQRKKKGATAAKAKGEHNSKGKKGEHNSKVKKGEHNSKVKKGVKKNGTAKKVKKQ